MESLNLSAVFPLSMPADAESAMAAAAATPQAEVNGASFQKQPGAILTVSGDGRLMLKRDGAKEIAVSVKRCFPWSQPLSWLSLRDEESTEVALVEDIDELEPPSREALVVALSEASFVFTIERILSVEDEFELRQWRVVTKQGERLFQTRMNVWPRELGRRSLLVQDVANDLYLVPDLDALDADSKKRLWAFLDDD